MVVGTLLAALIAVPAATAATYTVGTNSDPVGVACTPSSGMCSLRGLITFEDSMKTTPNPPDTIIVPAGVYQLSQGPLSISQSVTIAGAGAESTQIAQDTTSQTSRVFDIQPTANSGVTPTVVISGLATAFGKADSTNGFFGGDVRNQANLTLSEDLIEDGTTTSGSGAGVSNDGGTLTVTHSLIALNGTSQTNDSGGIQNFGPNPVTGSPGHLTVIDSTIADNTSAQGGGIMSWSDSGNSTTIINSTIAFNDGGTRNTAGGGLLISEGTLSIENSIVADNTVDTPATGTASNCSATSPGVITSLGHNLETATDCGFKSAGDHQNTDPQFLTGSLAFNGGNTETYALKATSPAVDAVPATAPGCSGSDQRDVSRPQGPGCDIGAYELFEPTEGQQFTTVVGQVGATSATINWGDNTPPSTGTVDARGRVTGTHTYAEEGVDHAVIDWNNSDGTPQQTPFDVKVVDAPLSATPDSVTATAGTPFNGPVATFIDADPAGSASDYTATINWGDGSASPGTVTARSVGGFQVSGTHTYVQAGNYATSVSITDAGGASTVADGTATVSAAPSPVLTAAPSPVLTATPPAVGTTTAAFSGSVNPDGLPTTAFFQYGIDPKYTGGGPVDYNQSTSGQSVGSDFASHTVSASVTGLAPNVVYHVRLVAGNSAGTTFGPDVTFSTQKPTPPSPPAIGKTFNVAPVSGVVLIAVNGQLLPVTALQQIPKNTLIDALHGTISLTTAVPGSSGARDAAAKGKKHKTKTQAGTFGGAIFKISQATAGAGKGVVTLAIVEGAALTGAPSYSVCTKHKAGDPTATAASSRTLQLLHASAHGKFRTKGRYSAATVLGTKWTVADRCDGTLTHDITDSVVVNDFVHHKEIVLHAGQSYLAKAPKHK